MHFGARLALIALALQFVLTFGHVHTPAAASTALTLLSKAVALGESGSHSPADKGLVDSDCPACALIQLAGTSTPAVAPTLPLPAVNDFITLRPHAELASATSPRFRSRARATSSAAVWLDLDLVQAEGSVFIPSNIPRIPLGERPARA